MSADINLANAIAYFERRGRAAADMVTWLSSMNISASGGR